MTAVEELVALLTDLQRVGTTVMALARNGRAEEPWTIYPDEYGVFDRTTRSQFYYHTHGSPDEAGHFHTVRLFDDHTVHLVAISMDRTGWPQALFTVNLWAIGDVYEPPDRLKRYARRFQLGATPWDPRLVRFVNLVFEAFLPEIERLQDAKEEAFAAYRATHPDANPFEDRSLEILSRVALDRSTPAGPEPPDAGGAAAARGPRPPVGAHGDLRDAAVEEGPPGRNDEGDEVGQWHLPDERAVPPAGEELVTLVDGYQYGSDDKRDDCGATEEWPIA